MIDGWKTCPTCGLAPVRKHGRDRRGQQVYECKRCGRSFTHLSGPPCSGDRFPPDGIALAVRYSLRYRLSYGDLAEWRAERGGHGDRSTLYDWVQHFTPLYEDAARPHRQRLGRVWSVDETDGRIGIHWPPAAVPRRRPPRPPAGSPAPPSAPRPAVAPWRSTAAPASGG